MNDQSIARADDRADDATGTEGRSSTAWMGSICVYLSAGLVFLAVVDQTGGLPFRMPPIWYVNPGLCYVAMTALFFFGCALLKQPGRLQEAWHPSQTGIRFDSLVLYSHPCCHLCDEAKATLLKYAQYLPVVVERNIDEDESLTGRFGQCVPVVEIDGKVRFRGRVDERLLHRLIEGTPARARS